MQETTDHRRTVRNAAIGGAFLMAMSAVGPGFLTQTATFTQREGANFGFAILMCIIVDVIVQLNIWRVIIVSGKRAQMIANDVFPGLGLNVLFGIPTIWGAVISAVAAVLILVMKNALKVVDRTVQVLAVIAVLVLLYTLAIMKIPYGTAVSHTFMPTKVNFYSILTIVGGTVGGYISFAGGHRLLEGGAQGTKDLGAVNLGALSGIGLASVIRIVLFLTGLAVVLGGATLDAANPAATIFKVAAGTFGYKFFGLLLFAAGMSSVIGSTFTSISFLDYTSRKNENTDHNRHYKMAITIGFIAFATLIFCFVGQPATVLVVVGAINGFILPIALGILLVASRKIKIMGAGYHHPAWLTWTGWLVVIFMAYAGINTVLNLL